MTPLPVTTDKNMTEKRHMRPTMRRFLVRGESELSGPQDRVCRRRDDDDGSGRPDDDEAAELNGLGMTRWTAVVAAEASDGPTARRWSGDEENVLLFGENMKLTAWGVLSILHVLVGGYKLLAGGIW